MGRRAAVRSDEVVRCGLTGDARVALRALAVGEVVHAGLWGTVTDDGRHCRRFVRLCPAYLKIVDGMNRFGTMFGGEVQYKNNV